MAYYAPYTGYEPGYYAPSAPMPDYLAQLRASQQMGPGMQQGGQIPPQQMPAQQQAGNGVIWVSGKEEADRYFIVPGSAVALWDINGPYLYLRKAEDSTGKPVTIVYKLVEQKTGSEQMTMQNADYVTREEFNALAARLEAMTAPSRRRGAKEETDNAEPAV